MRIRKTPNTDSFHVVKETVEVLPISNHEEADTRLNFHAGMSNEAAIIVEKDLDVFLLLIYILGK